MAEQKTNLKWGEILGSLRTSLSAIASLREQLAGESSDFAAEANPMYLAEGLHLAAAGRSLLDYRGLLTEEAVFHDRATGITYPVKQLFAAASKADQRAALRGFDNEVFNTIGNEQYLVIERRLAATHTGDIMTPRGDLVRATHRTLEIPCVDIFRLLGGRAIEVSHYHDLAGLMRQTGLLPDIPLGHDEAPVTKPLDMDVREAIRRSRRGISISSCTTSQAQLNRENCTQIHLAFTKHTPERFNELLAPNCVWIDMPTSVVLNGREAAVAHDYSNWARAFPNNTATVTNLIANNDWCVVEHVGEGLHEGTLKLGHLSVPPTKRKVSMRVLDIVGYGPDGRADVIRNYYDVTRMLFQLGVFSKIARQTVSHEHPNPAGLRFSRGLPV